MKRLLLLPLLLIAACADQGAAGGVAIGSAPHAVDLGSSSRIPRLAGQVGEGEGYDAIRQPNQPTARQAPMARATAGTGGLAPKAMMPAASPGAVDHSQMDHSQMDHSKMDRGGSSMPDQGGKQ
jgi:hypothetical protein